jgi:hypothetical protein
MQSRMTDALRNLELLEEKATQVFESTEKESVKRLRLAAIYRAIAEAEARLRELATAAGMSPSLSTVAMRRQAPSWRRRGLPEDGDSAWSRQSLGRRRSDYLSQPRAS